MTGMPPTLQEIESILRSRQAELARTYGLATLGIFGSRLRGENSEFSDLDLLVEFERPIGFLRFLDLEERLCQWLGVPVDLVTRTALKPRIGQRILNEVKML